jgi:hypothetical protein
MTSEHSQSFKEKMEIQSRGEGRVWVVRERWNWKMSPIRGAVRRVPGEQRPILATLQDRRASPVAVCAQPHSAFATAARAESAWPSRSAVACSERKHGSGR